MAGCNQTSVEVKHDMLVARVHNKNIMYYSLWLVIDPCKVFIPLLVFCCFN